MGRISETRFKRPAAVAARTWCGRVTGARAILTVAFAISTAACTTISVYGTDGKLVDSTTRMGLLEISVPPTSGAIAINRTDFGISLSRDVTTIGASRSLLVKVLDPDKCQAVFIANDPGDTHALQEMLHKLSMTTGGLCVVGKLKENQK